jgi:hypothetical protein
MSTVVGDAVAGGRSIDLGAPLGGDAVLFLSAGE